MCICVYICMNVYVYIYICTHTYAHMHVTLNSYWHNITNHWNSYPVFKLCFYCTAFVSVFSVHYL